MCLCNYPIRLANIDNHGVLQIFSTEIVIDKQAKDKRVGDATRKVNTCKLLLLLIISSGSLLHNRQNDE